MLEVYKRTAEGQAAFRRFVVTLLSEGEAAHEKQTKTRCA